MSQGTFRTRLVPVPCVPVEALRLTEDIRAIELASQLLLSVDRYNTSDEPHKDELWLVIQKLSMLRRHAENKLRKQYLVKNLIERRQRRRV